MNSQVEMPASIVEDNFRKVAAGLPLWNFETRVHVFLIATTKNCMVLGACSSFHTNLPVRSGDVAYLQKLYTFPATKRMKITSTDIKYGQTRVQKLSASSVST